jgi:hypothetical protein
MHSYISNHSITLMNALTGEVRASITRNSSAYKMNYLPNLILTGSNSTSAEIYVQARTSSGLII